MKKSNKIYLFPKELEQLKSLPIGTKRNQLCGELYTYCMESKAIYWWIYKIYKDKNIFLDRRKNVKISFNPEDIVTDAITEAVLACGEQIQTNQDMLFKTYFYSIVKNQYLTIIEKEQNHIKRYINEANFGLESEAFLNILNNEVLTPSQQHSKVNKTDEFKELTGKTKEEEKLEETNESSTGKFLVGTGGRINKSGNVITCLPDEVKYEIEQLPKKLRGVLRLEKDGYKQAEIAELMGVTLRTVKGYKSQAKKILKNKLIKKD